MSGGEHARKEPSGKALAFLSLAALGVVYGDIGTSPLYALKECFTGPHAIALSKENVLGVLSLIFWSLNFVVTFKYLTLVMRVFPLLLQGIDLTANVFLLVPQFDSFFKLLVLNLLFFQADDLVNLALQIPHYRRWGNAPQPYTCASFVHDVNSLVRQEAISHITRR